MAYRGVVLLQESDQNVFHFFLKSDLEKRFSLLLLKRLPLAGLVHGSATANQPFHAGLVALVRGNPKRRVS